MGGPGGMHGWGVRAWPGGVRGKRGVCRAKEGACMAKGGMCGEGGHAWQRGMHGEGGVYGEGACVAKGGMHGEGGVRGKGGHAWQKRGEACMVWTPPFNEIRPVNARAVRILLECILVIIVSSFCNGFLVRFKSIFCDHGMVHCAEPFYTHAIIAVMNTPVDQMNYLSFTFLSFVNETCMCFEFQGTEFIRYAERQRMALCLY